MGKPVILTAFDAHKKLYYWKSARRLMDYPHQKKFVKLGGVQVVHSFSDLDQKIHRYLKKPDADLQQRAFALSRECFANDGKATPRVIKTMLNLLNPSQT